ncbi:hypothetical protein B5X24_HaOG207819 [Helicoverpa armigera]|uniref:Protein quiver n=1 Tax=Helicoverpa armigera TaxID=29058 RepID=A0A2W1BHD5_HELAM|nr:hypothetical protein B5X24_HaOG207819 [Helicoverpa armigera]
MKFLILAIFCHLFSSCYLQETANLDDHNLIQPDGKRPDTEWPVQTFQAIQGNFYSQAHRTINPKPCTRRSNSEGDPIEHRLSPPPVTKVETLPDKAASLKPQSLKNGENDLKINDKKPPPKSQDLHTIRKALPITNPVIDSLEENHREILPDITPDSHPSPHSAPHVVTANEFDVEPRNIYISDPRNVVPNEFRPSNLKTPNDVTESNFFPEFSSDIPTQEPTSEPQYNMERRQTSSLKSNKCLHEDHQNNIEGHSRRSMSNDILRKEKELYQNKNDPYNKSNIKNDQAMVSVLNADKSVIKSGIDLKSSNKTTLPAHEKSVAHVGRPRYNDARREMAEPATGPKMGQSPLTLMQSERVCYACSTANNPSCWAPDKRTTVKYCRKGNNACITKTFGKGSTLTLIRDCGNSCEDSNAGFVPKYKSCSMCHSELCNGAYSINGNSVMFAIILTAIVKYYN